MNACTLPRVSCGNFLNQEKLRKTCFVQCQLCFFFKLKFAICTKSKIEKEEREKEEKH